MIQRKVCRFCRDQIDHIDYKDANLLKKFTSPYGKIEPGRRTGTCTRHQRKLTLAIKKSRFLALLPFVVK